MSAFLGVIGFLGIIVGIILLILGLIRKKKMKGGLVLALSFVVFIIALFIPSPDSKNTTKQAVESETKEVAETSEKTEEPKEEESTEKPSQDEVTYYQTEVLPAIDDFQAEYDRIWNDLWVTTFNGVSDGSVDVYTAYRNMTFIETNYNVLSDNIAEFEGENLSKENKKLLESYKEKLIESADYRAIASRSAAEMFDEGNLKPSKVEEIKSIISSGDVELMQAMANRLSIEENLGLTQQTTD
ncbi:hypothetical protein SFC08_09000 [Lysinibacillus halotolerans]|uniref:Uncharacterized protein n=1 Tax=Lysinibacillus halotolerans TaxID=1368476 RepID=A0A3M8H5Z4_9BACI|nr:hypothetical protein [Lysinibacillus halotolerans]RNC97832.1 hypothetical protein EC501_13500 [Lysinibacillus halotolerans]